MTTHWQAWHADYADETSPLSQRLRLVQHHIRRWLDDRSDASLTVVSACAGQGHDIIGTLAERDDAQRVRATLLETDPVNAAAARAAAEQQGLPNVAVLEADAGRLSSYVGAVPADLVLMVGVFGNITDDDVHRSVASLPQVCAEGATVIWTRTREAPDLTPTLRTWFHETGFVEEAFHAPDGVHFTVGVHRFSGPPQPLDENGVLFTFVAPPPSGRAA